MSESNGKVCCNCRHCVRKNDIKYRIVCTCNYDNRYLNYTQVMTGYCKHWSKDKEVKECEE